MNKYTTVGKEFGIYAGTKLPPVLKKAIENAVHTGIYLNPSHFVRDAIKEKLEKEHLLHMTTILDDVKE